MQKASTRKVISKACDACRKRKIKCDGLQSCAGCLSADIACTYDTPRGQGGNRGARAIVLNELRSRTLSHEIEVHFRDPKSPNSSPHQLDFAPRAIPEAEMIDAFIQSYINRVYPVVPLVQAAVVKAQADQADTSTISHQFILAFCAYVNTFGTISNDRETGLHQTSHSMSRELLDSVMSIQVPRKVIQSTPLSIYISFFLYGAWASQGDYSQAWYYLREAATLFMLLENQSNEWYDRKAQRYLFWILVVSERSHAIRKSRPITIPVLSCSPCLDEVEEVGLQYLASIFQPFNEVFFAIWNGVAQDCSKEWLLQLETEVRSALPPTLNVPDDQAANLRISQFWLQIKLWELFPRFGFLSSESAHECLTFQYPLLIAKSFIFTTTTLSVSSLQLHGVGMTEKVFDIACALADVLPFITPPIDTRATESLTQMTSLLMQLPGGSSKFVPLLLTKVHELHPDLVKTLCETVGIPWMAFSDDPMSPQKRFLYEEEVGRGLYTDLRRVG